MSNEVDLRQLAIDRGGTNQPSIRVRRRMLTRYVLPLLLIVGFLSLVAWASRDILFPPRPVMVVPVLSTTAEVRQDGTPLFKAAGWIEPRPTPVRVAALAPGVVEKLLVVEDQPVKAGEPIAELVKDDATLVYQSALADLELREAELEEAHATLVAAETRFKQPVHLEAELSAAADAALAKTNTLLRNLPFEIRRAESDHWVMKRDYDGKAAARGVISEIEIEIAESKAAVASELVGELRDRIESLAKEQAALTKQRDALKTQLELLADETRAKDEAQARIKGAGARIAQARVVVAEAKLQLDRMTVVAPVDGRVFRLIAHPGARIGSGAAQMEGYDGSTVVTMYRPEMLQVRVDVRFEDLPKVSLHQPVEIDNPALPSPLIGDVLFISSEADIQKNTLQVKVAIDDAPSVFKPEMLVDVTFLAPKQPAGSAEPSLQRKLYVLRQLIHQDQADGAAFVWLADQSDGIARKTRIQTGAAGSGGLVEVTRGLTISSRIISSGIDGLKDGARIQIAGEDPSIGSEMRPNGRQSDPMSRLPAGDTQ